MGCLLGQEHVLPSKVRRCEELHQTGAWQDQGVGHFITLPTFAHNPLSRSGKAISAEGKQRPSLFTDTQAVSFQNTLSSQVTLPMQTGKIRHRIWMEFWTIRVPTLFTKDILFSQANPKIPVSLWSWPQFRQVIWALLAPEGSFKVLFWY